MRLHNITDIEGFFKVIDSCKGTVELISNEGDRINLKSKLSQYFSLARLFSDGEVNELQIIAYEPEDTQKIIDFMLDCKVK